MRLKGSSGALLLRGAVVAPHRELLLLGRRDLAVLVDQNLDEVLARGQHQKVDHELYWRTGHITDLVLCAKFLLKVVLTAKTNLFAL